MSGPEPTRPQRPLRNRLNFLLFLSHALVFGAILLIVVLPTDKIADIFLQVSLGAVLAGLFGLIFTINLQRGLEEADIALERLSRGDVAAPIKPRWPLNGLINSINLLSGQVNQQAHRVRQVEQVRGRWLEQISEAAAQEERNRLARDLHDSIKQQLFSIVVSAATAQARWDNDPEGARQALSDVRRNAQEAQVEMKALLQQLAPAPLEKVGLIVALRDQCEALQYRTGAQVSAELDDLPPDDLLPPGAQETIFRLVQEGLSNVARHARASNVLLRLYRHSHQGNDWLLLDIADNGQGFDPKAEETGMGLGNMQGRAQQLGGVLEIKSAPGKGAFLRAWIPLAKPVAPQIEESDPPEVQRVEKQVGKSLAFAVIFDWLLLMILAFRIPLRAFSDDSGSDLNPYKLENLIWVMIALIPFIFDLWYTRHTTRKLLSLIEPGNRIEIRFQSMNLVSRMFLCGICFILLPLVPLNWPEWENASLAGLTLAIVCILLILYYYFKLKSLPELKSELLSSAKKEDQDKKEQNQFLWGIARIVQISVLFLLFFLNFLSKPETLSFPARTQEDWLRQLVIFMVALLLFLSLLGFWHFLMKKLHRSFNSMAQFPVKLVAILLIVAIIMYLTVLSSKFTMIGSFNDGEQYSRHYTVSWSPDGKILASSSDHGRVYLLDLDGRLKRTLLGHVSNEYGATTVAWSPNGKMLASTSNDEKVLLWDVEGRPIGVLHTLDKIKFSTLVWSADSKILAVAASDQKIWWWSVPDQKLITTLSSHTDDITCLAWSPDGRFLASGSRNGTIWLWTADGKEAMVLRGHDDQVNALAWSPDSKILASGSGSRTADFEGKVDTTVRLWGVDGKTIAILDSHNYKVTALAWSPDGKRLVSSDYKGTIKLWNRQGKEISSFIKRDKEFQGLAWSPDGKRLAAAGYRPDVWIFKIED